MKAGWEVKALGDVTILENGDRGKNYPGRKAFVTSGVPFINAGHISDGKIDWAEMNYIPEEHFQRLSRGKITKDDLLFCLRGSLGKFGHVTEDVMGAIASSLVIIRATSKIDVNFLKQFLGSAACAEEIEKYAAGAAQPNLGATDLKKFKVPLPPLAEQKRIVSILDEAFEGLDRAQGNAEANLKSARELFESILQAALRSKYQVEREVKLGEVCILAQGLAINKTTKHLLVSKSSKPLLRIKDLRSGTVEQYVAEEGYPSGAEVSADDIIYTRTGQIGLVFRGFSGVLHNNCFSIRCINGLDRNYCFWWLQERNFRSQIVSLASRAAQPDITHKIFKDQEITLPNEDNQKLAVVSIEGAFNQMQKLQTTYQTKLQDISDLRQSLLQKAFAGELT